MTKQKCGSCLKPIKDCAASSEPDCSRIAELEAELKECREALEEVKFTALTTMVAVDGLARIIRICIDAGVAKKLPELQESSASRLLTKPEKEGGGKNL